jgi:hypothetical protein
VASATATLGSRAVAAEPTPRRPAKDVGVGAAQLALGTGVALASALVAANVAFSGADDYRLLTGGLVVGTVATGLTVCAVGLASSESEGGCGGAMLGSGLGSLAAFPLSLMASSSLEGTILGFLGGYAIGSVAGATIGWHVAKRPRTAAQPAAIAPPATPAAALAPPADAWPELRRRTWAGAAAKDGSFKLTVPIVALTF